MSSIILSLNFDCYVGCRHCSIHYFITLARYSTAALILSVAKMRKKRYAHLLLFSLAGANLWFFGNLYEGIVIAPNFLVDSIKKVEHWQAFFTITNPIFFYIPLVPIESSVEMLK
jgi:hypothetical protein